LNKPFLVKCYFIYGLAMDSDIFLRLFSGVGLSGGGGQSNFIHSGGSNPILFAITVFFMLMTLVLLVPVYRDVVNSLIRVPWFTAIYVESLLSVFWSVSAADSFRYGITLWTYMLCGLIVSYYLSTEEMIETIGQMVVVLACLNIPYELLFPIHSIVPGWTGIYGEKNHLGIGMVIGLIALCVPKTKWTLFRCCEVALLVVMVVLSQSGTSLVCVFIVGLTIFYLRTRTKLRRFAIAAAGGLTLIGFVVIPDFIEKLLAAGGKDVTLTGRTAIWRFVVQQWAQKPLLGWGYTSFWSNEDDLIMQHLGWNPGYSHNGFLEIGLALGIVGVVIIVGIMITTLLTALHVRKHVSDLAGTWLLVSWVVLLLHDLTEVDFLIPAPLWFVLGAVYFLALRDQTEQARVRQAVVAQGGTGFLKTESGPTELGLTHS